MADVRLLVEASVKHLPPSASTLRLLDLNGEAGDFIGTWREDVLPLPVPGDIVSWQIPPESVDAVIALDYVLNDAFLAAARAALRPGGRLIVANGRGKVEARLGQRLEQAGYVRILVEAIPPQGVLVRGEKAHITADTLTRIRQTADQDKATSQSRFLHLLVQQTPNKPVWQMMPDDVIQWQAVALQRGEGRFLLAFTSLPKAVSLMQPAVLEGTIKDVNKVSKFRRDVVEGWAWPVLLNPALDALQDGRVVWIKIDPTTAEAPDE